MKKFLISAITTLSALLVPVTVSADDKTKVDTMYMNKTADFNYETQSGVITLENFVPGEMKVARDAKPIDAILVLDFSSSMEDSYSADSTYSKVVATKMYTSSDLYRKSNSSYISLANDSQTRTEQVYDKNKNALKKSYGGSEYDIYVIHTIDPSWQPSQGSTFTNKSRSWAYITVGGKRIFIRQDGSTIEEEGTTKVAYGTFPKGTDGYYITPAELDERTVFSTLGWSTGYHTNTRLAALQFAAGKFIDMVANHAATTGKTDRIAIVAFQASGDNNFPSFYSESVSNYLSSTSKTYLMECPTDLKASGYRDSNIEGKTFVAKRFIDMSSADAPMLARYAISNINDVGTTPVNNGVDVAKELMLHSGRTGDDVARYVIVFSDGDPTTTSGGDGFASGGIADKAVSSANALKNSSTHKTTVYTIYCNTEDPSSNANTFMDHLSSNYPSSTTYNDKTTKSETTYYKTAKDNLAVIFNDIAEQIIVETTSKYDVNTKLADFINNEYFQLPDEVDQSTAYDNIFVYENKCTGYSDGVYSWASFDDATKTRLLTPDKDDITITVTKGDRSLPKTASGYNDRIEIKGYDFSKNWCGMDVSKTPNVPHGARLVVKIPFVYTTTQVWGDLPTNSDDSGITVVDKETHEEIEEKKYPVPTLPFCYIKIQRNSLHKGESAIFVISKKDGSFIDKVVVNGTGSGVDTCALYGVPGEEFVVTETNWNWAYNKTTNPQQQKLTMNATTGKPESYKMTFVFTGEHKVPSTSLSQHQQEKDPSNLHNHDEAYKVNLFNDLSTLPTK